MKEGMSLGLSGGRDSAALAVLMRQHHPEFDIEYFFTDTGKELPEVYEFLGRLEGFLGKPMIRLNPDRDFDFWLTQYKNFLPSPKTRWCTRQLKIRPFEEWVRPVLDAGDKVTSYVAIRADEDYREGYSSTHANLAVRLPFRERASTRPVSLRFWKLPVWVAGLLPLAFPQWLHLLFLSAENRVGSPDGRAPRGFEEAKSYEKNALEHGSPFTWSQGESLLEMAVPNASQRYTPITNGAWNVCTTGSDQTRCAPSPR